jgi:hypothetical protein
VDAHPHLKGRFPWPRVPRERPLAGSRSENSILRMGKGDEEGVALVVDLSAAVRGESFPKEPVVVGEEVCVLAALRPEQLRGALDIRKQERCRGSLCIVHHAIMPRDLHLP